MTSVSTNDMTGHARERLIILPLVHNPSNLEEGEISEGEDGASPSSNPSQMEVKKSVPPHHTSLSRTDSSTASTDNGGTNTPDTPRSPGPTESMSADDLDRAKSLVLDLLGWGVSPEYLVECGVSTDVLYRIFTDLRLRLPSNLALPTTAPSMTSSTR
ncbi:hypothetical protein BJ138DRAFT_1091267 [Hygrophoropsis aurantiaca]|uniref:Uncharacterized protein n=1 Tax=Hygrophoropsis aurantiaca TaxID=72124 RepID=A0ACB8A5F6_9AGAM|nr:hypothetical protein BJ138DRAFT_1091267 [Hygrophoropsis aurantiaca]